MVQHMIKLVASDLDGTLLQNGAQELTPRALDLVRRLTEKGIVFVASSGRQYDNEVNLFKPVKDQISYIAENGSICIHKGNVIFRTVIAPELIRRTIDEVKKDGPHIIDKYLHHLKAKFSSEIKVVTSGNIWIDFIAPGTNKGTALLKLLDVLQIRPEECMAFGDQYNDVEMLQTVGTSYAMSNSAPGISYYSTYVTDSVEDVLEDLLAAQE